MTTFVFHGVDGSTTTEVFDRGAIGGGSEISADGGPGTPSDDQTQSDGADASIPLAWSGVPEGTGALAITMHHFPNSYLLLWGIDPSVTEIAHGTAAEGAWFMGSDKDGTVTSYTSPCSQSTGTHQYTITIYALAETPASLPQEDSLDVTLTLLLAALESVAELGRTTLTFNDVTN